VTFEKNSLTPAAWIVKGCFLSTSVAKRRQESGEKVVEIDGAA